MLAVTCLEALYLSDNAKLSHKFSQRVAALLGMVGLGGGIEIYRTIKAAYGIRSDFVHGAVLKANRRESAPKLCQAVLDFARASLSIFLQLNTAGKESDKKAFIDQIDNSLLDEKGCEDLTNLVEPVIITQ